MLYYIYYWRVPWGTAGTISTLINQCKFCTRSMRNVYNYQGVHIKEPYTKTPSTNILRLQCNSLVVPYFQYKCTSTTTEPVLDNLQFKVTFFFGGGGGCTRWTIAWHLLSMLKSWQQYTDNCSKKCTWCTRSIIVWHKNQTTQYY